MSSYTIFLLLLLPAFVPAALLPVDPLLTSSNGASLISNNSLSTLPNFASTFLPSENKAGSPDVSAWVPLCNGTMFGYNPPVTSCKEAWRRISPDRSRRKTTFGRSGQHADVQVPRRYSSCMWIFPSQGFSDEVLTISCMISGWALRNRRVRETQCREGYQLALAHLSVSECYYQQMCRTCA
jgi:hypothetical protein